MDDAAPAGHARLDFRVMGTDARLLVRRDDAYGHQLLAEAEQQLHELSARLTRFDAGSELERLNDAGEAEVSPVLLELLVAAAAARQETGGRFDVGVGAAMVAAGYDRTFRELDQVDDDARQRLEAQMAPHSQRVGDAAAPSGPAPYVISGARVTLRPGVRVDLGGIAKGWASDRIVHWLGDTAEASALVSLGGDIAVCTVEGDDPWPVSASLGAEGRMNLALAFGGLATSGWDGRMWRTASDEVAHHVIDPATGRPAQTDVARITVIGATCMDAEVWAKSLMLAGSASASAEAEARGLTSIIVRADGSSIRTGALA
jgi:thiamine biosynthesis lipoprotein